MTIYPTQWRTRPLLLVIDDDDLQRLRYRETLQASGFDVVETAAGSQGLTTFKEAKPDLILLGVMVPGIDGYESFTGIPSGST